MRKLVTLRKVKELVPIEGADRIEVAKVDGWQCVVLKGEFEEGDWGVYFEIDSMVPYAPWSAHLFKDQKTIDKGFLRIKTIRLRGQLSQGLMLPISLLQEYDLTEAIGVQKYEIPIPEESTAKGRFPSFIQKTDEERVQNLVDKYENEYKGQHVYITEKLDGSSFTAYCVWNEIDEKWEYGVCSRNLELALEVEKIVEARPSEERSDYLDVTTKVVPAENKFVSTARKMQLQEKMLKWCNENKKDLVLQGELIGPNVQGNRYKLNELEIRFFTAQDGKHSRLSFWEFDKIMVELGLESVPVLEETVLNKSYESLLASADGESVLNPDIIREGIVIRNHANDFSFKVISNKFLEEEK